GWRSYPASGKFRPDDDVKLSGTKTFEQVFVPSGGANKLPTYEFSYLEPGTGKYHTLATAPILVTVNGPSIPSPTAPKRVEGPGGEGASKPATASAGPSDILHIRTDGPGGGSFVPLYRRTDLEFIVGVGW